MEIDKSDKTILTQLEYNARIKEKELAKLCHLSKDAIRYRIRKLKAQNFILGHSCFVDYTKLGRTSYKLYLKTQGSEKDWAKLRFFLDEKPAIFARFESQSDWNFGLAYFAKTLNEFYLFERDLFSEFGHIIQSSELCHMVDASVFESRALLNSKTKSFPLFGEVVSTPVDDTDIKLLEILLKDSSGSLLSISENIKLSPDATKKRIQRLEREQVIRRYTSSINYQKLGFETYKVFIWVKEYTEDVEKRLLLQLHNYTNTRNIIRMVGPWKLEVEFICKNYDELSNIMKDLRVSFPDSITSINYAIFRGETYYPSKKIPA